jgi:acetylornithine deacetylase/succinyl-diaminopimelate desuccinylase
MEGRIDTHRALQDHIASVDVVKLASDLVKIPSCWLTEHREKDVAAYIYDLLRKEGLPAEQTEAEPGRFNVTGLLKGTGKGRSLMLCGHLDTVPAYDMQNALSGLVRDGKLYGRGACDMKGPLAAMLAALIGVHRSGIQLQGDLVFAGVIDEEEMGKGVDYLAIHGPFVDGAVIGEPTGMRIALGHKGLEWLKITVLGKKVHGGRMELGINAIAMAGRLIEQIYHEYVPILNQRTHPVLGHPTINIGRIEGGDQPSTVPGNCTLEIDRRWIPAESLEQVYDELSAILTELQRQDPRFRAELTGYYPPGKLLRHSPFCTEETDPIVQSAQSSLKQSGFDNIQLTAFPAWSDAGILTGYTKARCIVIGPGDLALAHTPEEYIETQDLEKAARFYGALAVDYCGMEE